jgi:hypothetical protein
MPGPSRGLIAAAVAIVLPVQRGAWACDLVICSLTWRRRYAQAQADIALEEIWAASPEAEARSFEEP